MGRGESDPGWGMAKRALSGLADKADKVAGKFLDLIGLTHPQPIAEPENAYLFDEYERTGTVPLATGERSEELDDEEFNRIIYQANIDILNIRIAVFQSAVEHYKREIAKVKSRMARTVQRAVTGDRKREALQDRIKDMWEDYDARFKNRKYTRAARDYKDKILELQRTLQAPSGQIDQLMTQTFTKVEYAPDALAAQADDQAKLGTTSEPTYTTSEWPGHGAELENIYKNEIRLIENIYLEPLLERREANQEWLDNS